MIHWNENKLIELNRGESAALGRRVPWVNRFLFEKYTRKNLEFFRWSWENNFSIKLEIIKLDFLLKKNRAYFQETKVNFVKLTEILCI